MSVVFRRAPWRKPHRRRFILSKVTSSTENITVDKGNLVLTPQSIGIVDAEIVSQAALTLTGQTIGVIDLEAVSKANLTLTGQSITDSDAPTSDVTPPTFVSGTVNLSAVTLTFDEAVQLSSNGGIVLRANGGSNRPLLGITGSGTTTISGTVATPFAFGQTATFQYIASGGDLRDMSDNELADLSATTITNLSPELITVDKANLTLTGQDIALIEYSPPPVIVEGSGGGGGPASDAVYNARRKYEQDKRDREEALWKGKPSTTLPDSPKKPPPASAEVKKTVTSPPADVGPDIAALIAEILAPMPMPMPLPMPDRHFDPEEDAAAILLLTEL